jgi:hypothetical protein
MMNGEKGLAIIQVQVRGLALRLQKDWQRTDTGLS